MNAILNALQVGLYYTIVIIVLWAVARITVPIIWASLLDALRAL